MSRTAVFSSKVRERIKKVSPASALSLLNIWSKDSSSRFVTFKFGESGGSTYCAIELADVRLVLSWELKEPEKSGELVVSLDEASFEFAAVSKDALLSGASLTGEGEYCLSITFPSGDWILILTNSCEEQDAIKQMI